MKVPRIPRFYPLEEQSLTRIRAPVDICGREYNECSISNEAGRACWAYWTMDELGAHVKNRDVTP